MSGRLGSEEFDLSNSISLWRGFQKTPIYICVSEYESQIFGDVSVGGPVLINYSQFPILRQSFIGSGAH